MTAAKRLFGALGAAALGLAIAMPAFAQGKIFTRPFAPVQQTVYEIAGGQRTSKPMVAPPAMPGGRLRFGDYDPDSGFALHFADAVKDPAKGGFTAWVDWTDLQGKQERVARLPDGTGVMQQGSVTNGKFAWTNVGSADVSVNGDAITLKVGDGALEPSDDVQFGAGVVFSNGKGAYQESNPVSFASLSGQEAKNSFFAPYHGLGYRTNGGVDYTKPATMPLAPARIFVDPSDKDVKVEFNVAFAFGGRSVDNTNLMIGFVPDLNDPTRFWFAAGPIQDPASTLRIGDPTGKQLGTIPFTKDARVLTIDFDNPNFFDMADNDWGMFVVFNVHERGTPVTNEKTIETAVMPIDFLGAQVAPSTGEGGGGTKEPAKDGGGSGMLVIAGVGIVILVAGVVFIRSRLGNDDTTVEQPQLPPSEVFGQPRKEELPDDATGGMIAAFKGMGAQDDHPHTVSDDLNPPTFNENVDSTVPPADPERDKAERAWNQALAQERYDESKPSWQVGQGVKTPNKYLQELYGKLDHINQLISGLEGDNAATVEAEDPLLTAWKQATDFNWTSYDPLAHAYSMQAQVQDLIKTYLEQGAEEVNKKIYNQKIEYMVNTVKMESDFAHGTAVAQFSTTMGSIQAENANQGAYPGSKGPSSKAPGKGSGSKGGGSQGSKGGGSQGSKGGKAPANEPQGFAPEPETVRMTPEQQGIKPGASESPTVRDNPLGMDTEAPTFHDEKPFGVDTEAQTVANKKNPTGVDTEAATVHDEFAEPAMINTNEPQMEAYRIETSCKNREVAIKQGTSPEGQKLLDRMHAEQMEQLRNKPPEWWDGVKDPGTKAYLKAQMYGAK